MTSPTVDPVSRRPPTNCTAARLPTFLRQAAPSCLAECNGTLRAAGIRFSPASAQRPQFACPAGSPSAESARNAPANWTLRTATRSFRHTAYRETNPLPQRLRTRRAPDQCHARRRRVARSTYCSEPSAILRSWRRVSSNFLRNEFSAPGRRNARHYKMCPTQVVDKSISVDRPSPAPQAMVSRWFERRKSQQLGKAARPTNLSESGSRRSAVSDQPNSRVRLTRSFNRTSLARQTAPRRHGVDSLGRIRRPLFADNLLLLFSLLNYARQLSCLWLTIGPHSR